MGLAVAVVSAVFVAAEMASLCRRCYAWLIVAFVCYVLLLVIWDCWVTGYMYTLFWSYNQIIVYNYNYIYMCVGDDRHCLGAFVHSGREIKKKKSFVQVIISTTCFSHEMRF